MTCSILYSKTQKEDVFLCLDTPHLEENISMTCSILYSKTQKFSLLFIIIHILHITSLLFFIIHILPITYSSSVEISCT